MEKPYSAFMNEITPDDIYRGFLGYGLFTDRLPPIFTSETFYHYCKDKALQLDKKTYNYIYYESMRNINVLRAFGIPNPFAYEHLCRVLKKHWECIRDKLIANTDGNTHKISRLHIRKRYAVPFLFELNYKNWEIDASPEPDMLLGNRYVVKTDISTCFPSIYTHSLCWALIGKATAKNNRDKKEWYNELDGACQKLRNGETHGLMIGPHASNLLSEIILTAVDKELCGKYQYIRNIDDYTCYVPSMEHAQNFLTDLRECLRAYDLSINYRKTQIISLPLAMVEDWVRELTSIPLENKYRRLDYKRVQTYLDMSIRLMQKNDMNSAILKYAIKVLSGYNLSYNAKQYYVKLILHLSVIYPYLVSLLDSYVFVPFEITTEIIQEFSEQLFKEAKNVKNYEALCYVLYFSIKYNFKIKAMEDIDLDYQERCNNCLFRMFSWLYYQRFGVKDNMDMMKKLAKILKTDDEVFDQNWLFLYEILTAGQLKGEWNLMKEAGISFVLPVNR